MSGHKFNPANQKNLNSERRRASLPPEKVLQDINIQHGTTWADVGCGNGYFTIPLADIATKVYALDIRPEMLAELSKALKQANINNVEIGQSEETKLPLDDGVVDGVLTSLVMHEVDEPGYFFHELSRILKAKGKLVVLEWGKVPTDWGPPLEHRLTVAELDNWAISAGFVKQNSWQWSNSFVGIEYCKNA